VKFARLTVPNLKDTLKGMGLSDKEHRPKQDLVEELVKAKMAAERQAQETLKNEWGELSQNFSNVFVDDEEPAGPTTTVTGDLTASQEELGRAMGHDTAEASAASVASEADTMPIVGSIKGMAIMRTGAQLLADLASGTAALYAQVLRDLEKPETTGLNLTHMKIVKKGDEEKTQPKVFCRVNTNPRHVKLYFDGTLALERAGQRALVVGAIDGKNIVLLPPSSRTPYHTAWAVKVLKTPPAAESAFVPPPNCVVDSEPFEITFTAQQQGGCPARSAFAGISSACAPVPSASWCRPKTSWSSRGMVWELVM